MRPTDLNSRAALFCIGLTGLLPAHGWAQIATNAAPISQELNAADTAPELRSAQEATAHLYRLAASDDRQAAVRFANIAVQRFAESAALWEAAGYVLRGAGEYARALDAYQNASRLDPANANALRGQILMLQRLGASEPAVALINAHPELRRDAELRAVVAQLAAHQLRYAENVEDRAQRTQRLLRVLAQLDSLILDAGGELKAAQAGESAPFDRLQAYVMLHREAQATQHYELLIAGGVELPAYARLQAAVAYVRLGQIDRAIPILSQLAQDEPDDVDSQLELFYALVDSDQLTQARERIDRLLDRVRSGGDREAELRVRIAAAMARAYGEQPSQALTRLDAILEEAPFSADARASRGAVYFWRGWPRSARDEAQAVLAAAPRNRDAKALQVQTDMALDDWTLARAHLDLAIAQNALSDRDAQQLASRLEWRQRQQVAIESGYGTGTETSIAVNREWHVDTRAYSSPMDTAYRLFAHLREAHTDVSPLALSRTWSALGVDGVWPGLAASLEVAHISGEPTPGVRAQGSWQPADGARIGLQAASSDPDTPARASASHIRERTAQLSTGYDFNESTGVGADLGLGRFSDGNRQINAIARFSQRLFASNLGKMTWNNYVGTTHDSLAAALAPYFDPAHASSQETELRGEWLGQRDVRLEKSRWHVLTVSIGRYEQSGFATHTTAVLRYEQRWTLSDHSEFGFGITRSHHPYDGNQEWRTTASLNYEGRF